MARRASTTAKTDQINFRLPTALIDRMERYKERHALHPSLTSIVVAGVTDWLDRHEPELPPQPKPKAK